MPVTMKTIVRPLARLALIPCFSCQATRDINFHQTFGYIVTLQQVMPPNGYSL